MESVNFAVPTITSEGMSKSDQNEIVITQATAIVVAAWLEYAKTVLLNKEQIGISWNSPEEAGVREYLVRPGEIPGIINVIQTAFRG